LSLSVEGLQTIKLEILEEILIKSWFKNIYIYNKYNEDYYYYIETILNYLKPTDNTLTNFEFSEENVTIN
jgi:hypothetical protein